VEHQSGTRGWKVPKVELYNFTLISGNDYLVQCASGVRYLMCGGTPWVVPIECGKKQGPNCKKTKENLGC